MLVSEQNKAIFLETPKTGSTVFRESYYAAYGDAYIRIHTHAPLNKVAGIFAEHYPNSDPSEFTVYAFYRDPIERFLSNWRYSCSQIEQSRTDGIASNRLYETIAEWYLSTEDYEARAEITFSLDRYLALLGTKTDFPTISLACPQTDFMDADTVLLNFADFNNEARKIAPLFGLADAFSKNIPIANATGSIAYKNALTNVHKRMIKSLYRKDYEFFKSRGIQF